MKAVKGFLAAILVIASYAMSDARLLLGAASHVQSHGPGERPSGGGATCEA